MSLEPSETCETYASPVVQFSSILISSAETWPFERSLVMFSETSDFSKSTSSDETTHPVV